MNKKGLQFFWFSGYYQKILKTRNRSPVHGSKVKDSPETSLPTVRTGKTSERKVTPNGDAYYSVAGDVKDSKIFLTKP